MQRLSLTTFRMCGKLCPPSPRLAAGRGHCRIRHQEITGPTLLLFGSECVVERELHACTRRLVPCVFLGAPELSF